MPATIGGRPRTIPSVFDPVRDDIGSRRAVSTAEGYLIDALREMRAADESPEVHARFDALLLLRNETLALLDPEQYGGAAARIDVEEQPLLHAAAASSAAWIRSYRPWERSVGAAGEPAAAGRRGDSSEEEDDTENAAKNAAESIVERLMALHEEITELARTELEGVRSGSIDRLMITAGRGDKARLRGPAGKSDNAGFVANMLFGVDNGNLLYPNDDIGYSAWAESLFSAIQPVATDPTEAIGGGYYLLIAMGEALRRRQQRLKQDLSQEEQQRRREEAAAQLVLSLRSRLEGMVGELEEACQSGEQDGDKRFAIAITENILAGFKEPEPLRGLPARASGHDGQYTTAAAFAHCLFGEENLPYADDAGDPAASESQAYELFAALQSIATAPAPQGDAARHLMILFGEAVQQRYHNASNDTRENQNGEGIHASA